MKCAMRRIDADDVEATIGEKQSECPCPASNVQHLVGAELVSELCVHIKIAAIGVERVVDDGKSRVLEDVIGHGADHRHTANEPPRAVVTGESLRSPHGPHADALTRGRASRDGLRSTKVQEAGSACVEEVEHPLAQQGGSIGVVRRQ